MFHSFYFFLLFPTRLRRASPPPPPPARSRAVCVPTFPPVGSARGRVHRVYCDTADSRPRPPTATHPAPGQWRGAHLAATRRLAPDWPPAATPLPLIGCVLPAATAPALLFLCVFTAARVKARLRGGDAAPETTDRSQDPGDPDPRTRTPGVAARTPPNPAAPESQDPRNQERGPRRARTLQPLSPP